MLGFVGSKKITEEYFKNEELRKLVALDPLEVDLIKNSKDMPLMGIIRVDVLYGVDPKIIEVNADFPDGLFMHDVSSEHIQKLQSATLELEYVSNSDQFIRLLEAHSINKTDVIFIGYNKTRKFLDEFEVTKIKLQAFGYTDTLVGAFEDLDFINNSFYCDGKKIDVLRRGGELSKLRTIPDFLQNIIIAENNNTLQVINNFKMRLLGHKSLLALLHHKNYINLFSHDEREAIVSLVPRTQKLEEVDFSDIINSKNMWVLKPSDLAEGEGVTIGTSVSQKEWEDILLRISNNKHAWILQEKVKIPEDIFTTIDKDVITSSHAYYDFCPHVFLLDNETTFGNSLVRFSNSEVLNIMKGGGLTYLFQEKK